MTEPTPAKDLRRPTWVDAAWICALGLLVYGLFGADTFYKADGQHLVLRLIHRDTHYPHHKLYMPALIAFGDVVAPLGLSPYRVAVWFSAVGVALGIALTRIGFGLLGEPRGRATLATLLVAGCPAIVLFACVVEFHGPFFALAALALVGFAALCARPTAVRAVLLGVLTSVAAGMHASGLVLPGLLLPWFVVRQRANPAQAQAGRSSVAPLPKTLWLAALAAAVHVGLTRVLAAPDRATEFIATGFSHPQGIAFLPGVIVDEWLAPFLPLSVLVFAAAFRRSTRGELAALLIGLAPYLYACLRLVVGDKEWGAYLLPAAIPAALLVVRSLPRGAVLAAFLVSALLAGRELVRLDRSPEYLRYAQGVVQATGGKPALLLLGDPAEVGPCLVHVPKAELFLLDEVTKLPANAIAQSLPLFDARVKAQHEARRIVCLTDAGLRFLESDDPRLAAGKVLLAHIRKSYALREIKAPGFRGWLLEAR